MSFKSKLNNLKINSEWTGLPLEHNALHYLTILNGRWDVNGNLYPFCKSFVFGVKLAFLFLNLFLALNHILYK